MFRWFLDAFLDLGASAERKLQRRERERRLEENLDEQRLRQEKDDRELTDFLLMSDTLRRIQEDLARDIDDAVRATRLAHERAVLREQEARDALEDARLYALILADGRRVYFTLNGRQLYGEDRHEISDANLLEQAQFAKAKLPHATTYEEYAKWHDRTAAAAAEVQSLAEVLDRLDTLQVRLNAGDLTVNDLEELRREQEAIVGQLPPDVRNEYEQLRHARSPSYRELSPDADTALSLTTTFEKVRGSLAQPSPEPIPDRPPAYKAAPDF